MVAKRAIQAVEHELAGTWQCIEHAADHWRDRGAACADA
jgi:hypothetical protein